MQVVVGEGPAGAALIESPIDKLIFTGSVATGKRVGEAAARRLLPVVLELGGKDPMIVLDDADVEIASSGALWGAFMNCRPDLPVGRALLRSSQSVRAVSGSLPDEDGETAGGKRHRLRGGDRADDPRASVEDRRGAGGGRGACRERVCWQAESG